MAAPYKQKQTQEVPLKIVGGTNFGRYPKVSQEQTFNMIVSDGFLVDYAGYKNVIALSSDTFGRGIYSSNRGDLMIAVIGSQVYKITQAIIAGQIVFSTQFIGSLTTATGDVFIAENNSGQIAITDFAHLYIYNWFTATTPLLLTSGIDFEIGTFPIANPGYISFQNARFIIAGTINDSWYLSALNNGLVWTGAGTFEGRLQTKPDTVQAAIPVPGGGNNLALMGHTVGELWQDVGRALFPYQKSSTTNIDFGCLNPASIASLDHYVVWLAANEQSGATLMVLEGNTARSISTDGIDFKLNNLSNPDNCSGFLFRQDGHVIYQFTFPDDNLSYIYDFNTGLFCTVTDENSNYHIAKHVVFFNNNYYFVSFKDGNIYRFGTQFTNFQYGGAIGTKEIPRVRVCPPVRLPSSNPFILQTLVFTLENGRPNRATVTEVFETTDLSVLGTESAIIICTESGIQIGTEASGETLVNTITTYNMAVDLSISRDGGETFGASLRQYMNPVGARKSRFQYRRLGRANDATMQLKFIGLDRFVCTDGLIETYQ